MNPPPDDSERKQRAARPLATAIGERLTNVEFDVRSHSESISALVDMAGQHRMDITDLQKWRVDQMIAQARQDERGLQLLKRLDDIETGQKTIINGLKTRDDEWGKYLRIAVGAIVTSAAGGIAYMLWQGFQMAVIG